MWNFLISINKKLIYAIPVMIVLGFIFGKLVSPETVKQLKSLIVRMTFLMVYPMMVTLIQKFFMQQIYLKPLKKLLVMHLVWPMNMEPN